MINTLIFGGLFDELPPQQQSKLEKYQMAMRLTDNTNNKARKSLKRDEILLLLAYTPDRKDMVIRLRKGVENVLKDVYSQLNCLVPNQDGKIDYQTQYRLRSELYTFIEKVQKIDGLEDVTYFEDMATGHKITVVYEPQVLYEIFKRRKL